MKQAPRHSDRTSAHGSEVIPDSSFFLLIFSTMGRFIRVLFTAAKGWSADNAFKHSAAVSFYTLFSLAPVTLIAVSLASVFFGEDVATQQFNRQLTQLVGKASADVIQQASSANALQDKGWLATTIGVVLLVVGATTVFGQIQTSLNDIWCVTARPSKHGWMLIIVQRLISFAMVIAIGFLLLSSLVLTTALTAAVTYFQSGPAVPPWVLRTTDMVVGIGVITTLFALLFKILPDAKVRWKECWLGAVVTAVLFSIGRYLIALYLGHSSISSSYGPAGALVALLIWIYYSSAILFYGAEYVRAYHLDRGLTIEPKKTAVVVERKIVDHAIRRRLKSA